MATSPRTNLLRTTLMLVTLLAASSACTSGSSDSAPTGPQLGEVSDQGGLTAFAQSLRADDDLGEPVPGFANMWDLGRRFSIVSGGDGHFDGALTMRVEATSFPSDQTYGELTFMTPEFGTSDGILAAVVYDGSISGHGTGTGTYSVAMAPTQNARLTQTLDLTSAVAPVTLNFMSNVFMFDTEYSTELSFVDVSIKDTANGVLEQVYYRDSDANDVGINAADLSAYAGRIVRLAIEARSTPHSMIEFDAFTVFDDDATEFVVNGGFETGTLSGWSRNTPSFVRNVTSGERTVDSLDVTRSFYAVPSSRWSRMVDVFTNNTGATIDRTITYEVDLGSQGDGILYGSDAAGTLYDTPDLASLAITTWDSVDGGKRDIGWAFGMATTIDWTSDDTLGASGNGSDVVTVAFDISVAPGESVALVNFLVLDTDNTGNSAADVDATADVVDGELQDILNGWPADASVNEFTSGMTQAQIDAVANF